MLSDEGHSSHAVTDKILHVFSCRGKDETSLECQFVFGMRWEPT
jgi:hypothetical protein